ncbi:CHAP domain-containing protein [Streptomyces ardesiacus]|uniref:CHAP domain-containing protein n=1 Tax=Streptomyces ardesiacus TaxID=285564 RepID=UPI003669FBE1
MSNASKIVSIAKGEVGYREGKTGSSYNNKQKYSGQVPGLEWSNFQPWCATFVSWAAMKAGVESLYPRTASCLVGAAWFKKLGRWSEYPAVGAQVFYGPNGGTHTGLVYDYDATYVYTVEGNTNDSGSAEGNGVYLKKRRRRDAYVYGYGYPKFSDGIKSADPKYAKEAPKAPAKSKPASKPSVSLAHIKAARTKDMPAKTGHTTYPAEVKLVEAALKAEGLMAGTYANDGSWGTTTQNAYDTFRRRVMGLTGKDAVGEPGMASLSKLGSRHGFTVKA